RSSTTTPQKPRTRNRGLFLPAARGDRAERRRRRTFTFSLGNGAGINGARIGPGATPLTRIFSVCRSFSFSAISPLLPFYGESLPPRRGGRGEEEGQRPTRASSLRVLSSRVTCCVLPSVLA